MSDFVTIDEVRHFILDRTVEDNDLDLDLAFSDAEILNAMKRAARDFNSVNPSVVFVDWNKMPLDTNVFLEATAEHLYTAELGKLRRNDMDYNAGGVSVNLAAKRIAHYEKMIQEMNKSWTDMAKSIKVSANYAMAFRIFD